MLPRRISYSLPSPDYPLPILTLPPFDVSRRDRIGPIYTHSGSFSKKQQNGHPRHRLPVQAMVLDFSTDIGTSADGSPGGILYSGSRDGLICATELNVPTRRRLHPYGSVKHDDMEEEFDEDGDAGGESDDQDRTMRLNVDHGTDRYHPRKRTSRSGRHPPYQHQPQPQEQIPINERWEIDDERIKSSSSTASPTFRQSIEAHTNCVTDLALADYSRAVISTSDDGLVLLWRPHSTASLAPAHLGFHSDYVRALALGKESSWVASGGFDRIIKLWDIKEGRRSPLLELPIEDCSIYTLATTPSGSVIAAGGSGKRVVRVYDPRARRQVANLAGHTDMIRKTLLSEDGKWCLSASSDTTVKLWHLTNQKCLGTFAVHSSSVFSLFTQHPNLERFYSGDRSGMLCKIDFEGCGDPAEGEAVVLARDGDDGCSRAGSGGINSIVARDDSYVWTAAGSNGINRWQDIPSRLNRAGAVSLRRSAGRQLDGESTDALLNLPAEPPAQDRYPERDRSGLPSVSFLEGLTTTLSRTMSSPSTHFSHHLAHTIHRPTSLRPTSALPTSYFSFPSTISSTSNDQLATSLLGIPYASLVPVASDDFGILAPEASATQHQRPVSLVSHYSFHHSLTEVVAALAESQGDDNVAKREYWERKGASDATPLRSEPDQIIDGDAGGILRAALLNDRRHIVSLDTEGDVHLWDLITARCIGIFEREEVELSKKQATDPGDSTTLSILELVKERIESEGATQTYCSIEGRGKITVHLDESQVFDGEIYADEALLDFSLEYPRDHRLNIGKWILRSLFGEFISAEVKHRKAMLAPHLLLSSPPSTNLIKQELIPVPALSSTSAVSVERTDEGSQTPRRVNTVLPSFLSLAGLSQLHATPSQWTPGMTIALATPAIRPALPPVELPSLEPSTTSFAFTPFLNLSTSTTEDNFVTPTQANSTALDYFSLPPTPSPPDSAGSVAPVPSLIATSTTPGGGLMGRLRFGGKKKGSDSDKSGQPPSPVAEIPDIQLSPEENHKLARSTILSKPLDPCQLIDAPRLSFNRDTTPILISEKGEGGLWRVVYRGLVGTGEADREVLQEVAPNWLLEFVLLNTVIVKEQAKISFVVLPVDGMPELPNANARLTANRNLRISKVLAYVASKLDLPLARSRGESITSQHSFSPLNTLPLPTSATTSPNSAAVAQRRPSILDDFVMDDLEILCGGVLLSERMTLSILKLYYWRSSNDIVLNYRRRVAIADE